MIDFGKYFRQRLIHRQANLPIEQRRKEYREYIDDGFSEHAATSLSQYHPLDDDVAFRRFAWWMIGACVVALTILFLPIREANSAEVTLIDCMNGQVIAFDDGSRSSGELGG